MTVEETNADQIAERQAIEGGSGRYEALETITHPLSNRLDDLEILARGYAHISLAISGTMRVTLSAKVRGYGFRAGQTVAVDLPTFGVEGNFVFQRVSVREESATQLLHEVELTTYILQQRAYEVWSQIIQTGKIVVQGHHAFVLPHDSVVFTTPGVDTWEVPVDVSMITITITGASGGGGGGSAWWLSNNRVCTHVHGSVGGKGGNGGKTVASVNVIPGQVLDIVVGSRGALGVGGYKGCGGHTPVPTAGTDATISTVHRGGISLAQAYGGKKGGVSAAFQAPGPNGAHGGGIDGIVSVGGGQIGGAGGAIGTSQSGGGNGANGAHGVVTIEW